ncbi:MULTISPECIES: formate dehydrogenase subunit delta [Paraburkholderia]|uniref:Formate dehydrogenase delta subunit n=1 Tax=Paraburkholderia tropica TaxID=92647 RepID=A0A1A5XKA6_9BURK|nr:MULTISPECIES: formate dehydrogenase subunit delta [Paraburkholderia]MBB2979349.1 formate dehydrogenase subunit delta [Paraburkholderia tropica]MDE1143128.1 formate dehydrogenase subunit delta [Paraburkholderia tropica]OBR53769.1 formate dehydrogenase [Paraburkholderia tropica]PXX14984.1 formate dehydrogenase delta subunit [Paraburkholderia tropica]PZW80229.1 formate dehydrogenase delta subunit [Paraburkholderia tropica]
MKADHLIEMANQIGMFFDSLPDREEALLGIAEHIRKFWEPRMRRTLLAALDAHAREDAGFSEIVFAALSTHREALAPAAA